MTRTAFIVLSLLTFLLTACGANATPVPATETSTPLPTSTFTLVPTVELVPTPAVTDTPAATVAVSFANDVMPILQSRCFNCHGGRDTKEGLSFASFGSLMAGSDNGLVVMAGDPDNSLLIQQIVNGKMPKKGPKLTPDQLQILIDWIAAGALDN